MKFKNSKVEEEEVLTESLLEGVDDYLANKAELEVTETEENEDEVFAALDSALSASLENMASGNNRPSNIFIWGDPGSGKTSRVKDWAEGYRGNTPENYLHKKFNLVKMKGPDFDEVITRGAVAKNPDDEHTLIRLSTTEYDKLNKPGTILYIDEANRTKPNAIDALLKLIDEKVVMDSREESNERTLNNLIFTILTANYADNERGVDTTAHKLSAAMINRGGHMHTKNTPDGWLYWFAKDIKTDIKNIEANDTLDDAMKQSIITKKRAKFDLAKKLIDGGLQFDDRQTVADNTEEQMPSTNSRSLTFLFDAIDGSKDDLLRKWERYCNPNVLKEVKALLSDYQDDPNLKSNKALKYNSQSSLLNKNREAEDNALVKLKKFKKDNPDAE